MQKLEKTAYFLELGYRAGTLSAMTDIIEGVKTANIKLPEDSKIASVASDYDTVHLFTEVEKEAAYKQGLIDGYNNLLQSIEKHQDAKIADFSASIKEACDKIASDPGPMPVDKEEEEAVKVALYNGIVIGIVNSSGLPEDSPSVAKLAAATFESLLN